MAAARAWGLLWLGGGASLLAACGLPVDGEGLEPGSGFDGSARDAQGPAHDATTDHATAGNDGDDDGSQSSGDSPGVPDTASDTAGDGGAQGDSPGSDGDGPGADSGCPGSSGPIMVDVGTFCVDSTEVTQSDYLTFIAARVSTAGQPSYCSWNTSYTPTGQWPPTSGTENVPVTSVDWCDAYAYCAWAGKRLCGEIGGGPVDPLDDGNAADDQWYNACSHGGDGEHSYPYGNTYGSMTCNGIDANGGNQIVDAVGTFTSCVGGFPGLFDMSGNVREWEDSCGGTTGANDQCNERGGSCNSDALQLECNAFNPAARDTTSSHVGIRCCAP